MVNSSWYYALDDRENGPVGKADVVALIAAGQLNSGDLVWTDGMPDWAALGSLDEFRSALKAAPAAHPSTVQPPPAPDEHPPARSNRRQTVGVRRLSEAVGSANANVDRPEVSLTRASSLFPLAGRPMLIAGLLIVLASRGCDAVGQRYVDRLQAQSAIAPARFQQQWEQQRNDLQQQQRAINDQDVRTPTDNELLRQLNRRLEQLQTDMQRQQQELEQGAWRQLESVARDADANNKLWAYWRGLFFVFGTFLLTLGLLAISYGGDGAERWVCLVILAIIIYSLFVGGAAWSRQ